MSSYYRTLLMEQVIDGAYYVNLIITYANSQGWTIPSTATINTMITLVDNMLSSGIWNKYDIFYNFGYNDINLHNFSRINWKNPGLFTISYTSVTLPNYTTNGYKQTTNSSGVTAFSLDTNFIPSINGVNYTLNNAGVTKYTTGAYSASGGSPTFQIWSDQTTTSEGGTYFVTKSGVVISYNWGVNGSITSQTQGGPTSLQNKLAVGSVSTLNRINASNISHYINGLLDDTVASISTSLSTTSFQLLSDNFIAGSETTYNMFGVGGEMNSTDNSNMNTYYSTFKTSLGL